MLKKNKLIKCLVLALALSTGACDKTEDAKKYKVTWVNYDDEVLEVDEEVVEGTTPTYDGYDPYRDVEDQYAFNFKGWDKELSPVTGDITYKATYEKYFIRAKVTFDLDGGTSNSYVDSTYIYSLSSQYFFFDVTKETYKFDGWSYNGTKVFNKNGDVVNEVPLVENMNFKAIYDHSVTLTITQDPNINVNIIGAGTYEYGTKVHVEIPNIDDMEAYWFEGFYYKNGELFDYFYDLEFDLMSDLELVAKFSPRMGTVKISSYQTNIGLVGFDMILWQNENHEKEFQVTSEVTVRAYRLDEAPEVSFLGWFDGDTKVSNDIVYTFTLMQESLELVAKWDCFILTAESEDISKGAVTADLNTKYLTSTSVTAIACFGYKFEGWYDGDTKVSSDSYYTFSMPARNLTLKAKFVDDISHVTVRSSGMVQGSVSGSGDYKPGETVTARVEYSLFEYRFSGWFIGEEMVSNETEYTFVMGNQPITIVALMTPVNYKLDVISNNEEMGTVTGSGTYGYGTYATLVATPKEGYHFDHWSDVNGFTISESATFSYFVLSCNTTIKAHFAKD